MEYEPANLNGIDDFMFFEDGEHCRIARDPDQVLGSELDYTLFYTLAEEAWNHDDGSGGDPTGVYSYILDTARLAQADDYWNGAWVDIYSRSHIERRIIADYDDNKLYFDVPLYERISASASYSIVNHPHVLDSSGEFAHTMTPDAEGYYTFYLWPKNAANLTDKITIPRKNGIFANGKNYIIIEGLKIVGFYRNGISFINVKSAQILNNTVSDIFSNRGYGMHVYLNSEKILVAYNTFIKETLTFQDIKDFVVFGNTFNCEDGSAYLVKTWGDVHGRTSGFAVYLHNTILGSSVDSALSLMSQNEDPYPQNYVINNIIDGIAAWKANQVPDRSYNLYTSYSWLQQLEYGWELNEGEIDGQTFPLNTIFTSPYMAAESDYTLIDGSPAIAAEKSVTSLLEDLGITGDTPWFPDFNFTKDKADNLWADPPSIGAYENTNGIVDPYILTLTDVEHGTYTKNPDKTSYRDGESVEITAVADTGYVFESWSGDASGTNNPLTVTMNSHKYITALYRAQGQHDTGTTPPTDTTPPAKINPPIINIDQVNKIIDIQWDEAVDQESSINYYYLEVLKDDSMYMSTTINATFLRQMKLTNIEDGVYKVRIQSFNTFGLSSEWSEYTTLTVLKPLSIPRITSLSVGSGKIGSEVNLTINGEQFEVGTEVSFGPAGITVNSVGFIDANRLSVNISIAPTAFIGEYYVTVTNPDTGNHTLSRAFAVTEGFAEKSGDIKIQGGSKGFVNPLNNEFARIHFKASETGLVKLKIYSTRGQLIWETSKDTDGSEDYIIWACQNADNEIVASGIYIVYVKGPGIEKTKKIAIIK